MKLRSRRPALATVALFSALLTAGCPEGGAGSGSGAGGGGLDALGGANLPNAFELCNRASEKLSKGDPKGALEDLDGAVSLDPGMARVFHLKGAALRALDQRDEALKAFERTLALDPGYGDPDFLAVAGRAFMESGDPQRALALIKMSSISTPQLLLLSAQAKEKTLDHAGAQADAQAALSAAPTSEAAKTYKAKLDAATEAFERRYQPAEAPERLGETRLSLRGLELQLPKGFKAGRSATRPKARRKIGDAEVVISLAKAKDSGEALSAWREALVAAAELQGARVVASEELSEPPGVFLHVIEPSAESDMFEPFTAIRYQWVFRGEQGAVRLTVELEVDPKETDLPEELRQDVLAALATLKRS